MSTSNSIWAFDSEYNYADLITCLGTNSCTEYIKYIL